MADKTKRIMFNPAADFMCTAECGCKVVFHHINQHHTWVTTLCPAHRTAGDDAYLDLIETCCLIRDYEIHEWNKANELGK